MKHFLLFVIGIVIVPQLRAQEQKTEPKQKKIHIGLDYSFIRTDMKLLYMTQQNTWNGTEFELRKFEKDEIDEMNSREEYTRKFQSLSLEAGMVLLNKPPGKWFIDGTIAIEWRVIDQLTISAYGAYANDLIVHGGIRYNF